MAKTYPCERVDLDFVDTRPVPIRQHRRPRDHPRAALRGAGDAESWPHWATVITNVAWTSPEPRGIGTTRTVSMRGGIIGDEEFLAWEPFSHMAFRFNQSTSNAISAFAEDYRVVRTPRRLPPHLGDGDEAQRHRGPARHDTGQPVMAWLFQRFLHNLRRYTDERYAASGRISTAPPTPSV